MRILSNPHRIVGAKRAKSEKSSTLGYAKSFPSDFTQLMGHECKFFFGCVIFTPYFFSPPWPPIQSCIDNVLVKSGQPTLMVSNQGSFALITTFPTVSSFCIRAPDNFLIYKICIFFNVALMMLKGPGSNNSCCEHHDGEIFWLIFVASAENCILLTDPIFARI